jgi:beta-phosphoglucomutase
MTRQSDGKDRDGATAGLRAVIFDVDGVLVDSYRAHFESWRRLAQEMEETVDFTEEHFAATFGRRSAEIIRETLLGGRAASDEELKRLDDRKEALYREIISENFPAMDGAKELVERLREAAVRVAVGSSGPPENVRLVLERVGIAQKVDAMITGHDVAKGKPHPEVFLKAATALGEPAECCVVVEDAPAGIEAAHRAGMACVGLASTGRTRADLQAAELVADRLDEIEVAAVQELARRRFAASGAQD